MKSQRRVIFGLFLILIGVVLLLDNLDILPGLPDYIFNWVNIFLLVAVANLLAGNIRGAFVFSIVWGFFTLHQYANFDMRDYWPLILVAVGLSLMMRKQLGSGSTVPDEYFDEINVFGGSSKKFTSQNLKGGKCTNIFGGSDIDLRESKAVDGATIEVFTLFGGCDIIVPQDWNVSVNTTSIFGGFDDKRESISRPGGITVRITGMTIFGGGDLKTSK